MQQKKLLQEFYKHLQYKHQNKMNFNIKNILGHKLSTFIGVFLAFSTGIGMFLCVHFKYATFGEVMPYIMLVIPTALSILYAPQEPPQNPQI